MRHRFWVQFIQDINDYPNMFQYETTSLFLPFLIVAAYIFPSLKFQACPHKITKPKEM